MRVGGEEGVSIVVECKFFWFEPVLNGSEVEIEEFNKFNSSKLVLPLGVVAWRRDSLAALVQIVGERIFSGDGDRSMLYGGFKKFLIGGVSFFKEVLFSERAPKGMESHYLREY